MKIINAGEHNTEETLKKAFEYSKRVQLNTIVVASTVGDTGVMAAKLGKEHNIKVIVVTHNTGFATAGRQQLSLKNKQQIEQEGALIHTGTMVLRGVGSAIRKKMKSSQEELIADTLRIFGQGVKVCVEMAAMVADAGLVTNDEDLVIVAGTGRGADTAVRIAPASSNSFFDIKVREIITKPHDF